MSGDESDNRSSDDSDESEDGDLNPGQHRLGTTNWCTCHNCGSMPTVMECLCCREVHSVEHKLQPENGPELSCLTDNQRFYWICLDRDALEVAMLYMADLKANRLERPVTSR